MFQKLLLCVALAACWTTSIAELPTPVPIEHREAPESCAQAGERLRVYVCRRDYNLEWMVTNQTHVPLLAFVAPPAGPIGNFDRGNVIARLTDGHLVLTKMQPPPYGGEGHPAGVVKLMPGETDTGVVPIGAKLNVGAPNLSAVAVSGTSWVFDVTLEVAFIEAHGDDTSPLEHPDRILVVMGFDRKRQEMVRSPVVRWR
jgi:hypothetical protein